jgi:branched-chain amino acid transport system ATP-binding protein
MSGATAESAPPGSTDAAAPVLELRGVSAGYAGTAVLNDVSLTVPAGSVVALLGPNGAGKTTLLRVASGLLRCSEGSVLLGGEDVTRARPHQLVRKGMCHIPESRGIYPSLTVRENLVLHIWRGEEKTAVDRAVENFPILGKKLNQPAGELSGGQQQMLAVVRSYIAEPRLVLVDEVSMGLAPVIVDQIYEFLKMISQQGAALLLVEQYVARALAIAQGVVLLTKGRVAFAGPPSQIKDDVFEHYMGASAKAMKGS